MAYRHCMLEQARNAAKAGEPTYKEALQFNRNCTGLAIEAATVRTRETLGAKFDTKTPETANHIRHNLNMIVQAHVCAIAADRPSEYCTSVM